MKRKIMLNGESTELTGVGTIADLVDHLGYADKRIAVEHNGNIIPRSTYEHTGLADGDQVEIVIAVGGG